MTAPAVHFVATPDRVIAEMLRLAEVGAGDVVYDLGCGDGRILIAAARHCGSRGVGVDVDSALIEAARAEAAAAGLTELVRFERGDFFTTDLSGATVVTLYLLDSLNIRLRPRILSQCAPGTRVVSYSFEMGDWQCDAHTPIAANGVSLWVVPANVTGVWRVQPSPRDPRVKRLLLEQQFQRLSGTLELEGRSCADITGTVAGACLFLEFVPSEKEPVRYSGTIENGALLLSSACGDSLAAAREFGI